MSPKNTTFLFLLIFTLSYSFFVYSKESNLVSGSTTKNCSQIQFLLLERKENISSSVFKRKNSMSNIFSSMDNLSTNKNLKNKEKAKIEEFKNELRSLLNDHDELIFQIDSILKTNCMENKSLILEKIKKLNLQFKNLSKKDEKIINQFESDVKIILKN